ncbi:hypothetical protein J6590_003991 [Homalodisca vitripennis]|nr:hypothetical protein J6590_003991 [Homalodisca vitripennis]
MSATENVNLLVVKLRPHNAGQPSSTPTSKCSRMRLQLQKCSSDPATPSFVFVGSYRTSLIKNFAPTCRE